MRKLAIVFISVLMLTFSTIACSGNGGTPEPKDVLPMSVQGFYLSDTNPQKEISTKVGVVVSAENYFQPEYNSIYWGKVDSLVISVTRYKDENVCKEIYEQLTKWKGCAEISMSEGAMLCYNDMFGEASVDQQQGKFLLSSDCLPPPETTSFDEAVMKQAAIEGFSAISMTQ
jgi:hypothetical protein